MNCPGPLPALSFQTAYFQAALCADSAEGALKADIAHALTGRTFAVTVGVNNTMGLDELFSFLRRNGTEEIVEAEDMDKYCNTNVSRGASKVHRLTVKNGLRCRRLVWNPNYKGIDDWQLALRRKELKKKEREQMNFKEMYLNGMCPFDYIEGCVDQWRSRSDIEVSAWEFLGLTHEEYQMYLQAVPGLSLKEHLDGQRRTQKFRVYQLDFKGIETFPFAYRGIEDMREAGYEQPPAESYHLVYNGELTHPREWTEKAVLEHIFDLCNDDLPEGYRGTACPCLTLWSCMTGTTGTFSTATHLGSPWCGSTRSGLPPWKKRMGMNEQMAQLDAVGEACRALGAEVRRPPGERYLTAMVWDGWGRPYDESRALAIQQEIKQKIAQYPGLVCRCVDPFSTLVYAV